MFAFCVGELGFSEDAAYNRITVARVSRRMPAIVVSVRSGQVHLAGLRLLAPHLTAEKHRDVLAEADGRSKREIEELVDASFAAAACSSHRSKASGPSVQRRVSRWEGGTEARTAGRASGRKTESSAKHALHGLQGG
jgi:hypothetical protein